MLTDLTANEVELVFYTETGEVVRRYKFSRRCDTEIVKVLHDAIKDLHGFDFNFALCRTKSGEVIWRFDWSAKYQPNKNCYFA